MRTGPSGRQHVDQLRSARQGMRCRMFPENAGEPGWPDARRLRARQKTTILEELLLKTLHPKYISLSTIDQYC